MVLEIRTLDTPLVEIGCLVKRKYFKQYIRLASVFKMNLYKFHIRQHLNICWFFNYIKSNR